MTTPVYFTSFEHGVLSANGGGLVSSLSSLSGSPSVQDVVKHSGNYALKIVAGASTVKAVWNLATPTIVVGQLYFYVETMPVSGTQDLLSFTTTGSRYCYLSYTVSDSSLRFGWYGTTSDPASSITIQTGQWYRLDFKLNVGANPFTADWRIDDTDQTQATRAYTADTVATLRIGDGSAGDWVGYFDDLVLSFTAGDYPIDAIEVVGLSPDTDGTHNGGTNTMEDQAGIDIVSPGYTTAHDLVNSVPIGNTTTYVRQATNGTSNYVEVHFADTDKNQILGVMAILAYRAATANSDNGGCIIIDEDATETTLWGRSGALADYSESSVFYKSVLLPTPAGGWDLDAVNALKARMGYSSDTNPNPWWVDLIIEVLYVPVTGYTMPAAYGSFALDGQDLGLQKNLVLPADFSSFSLTGQDAVFGKGYSMPAAEGIFSLAGQDAGSFRTYALGAANGSFNLAGQDLILAYGRVFPADYGSFSVTGPVVGLLAGRNLNAVVGSYSLYGQAADLLKSLILSSGYGSFLLTGQDVTLTVETPGAYTMPADYGSFVLNGQIVSLLKALILPADSGAFSLTGPVLDLLVHRLLSVDPGSFSFTGQAADVLLNRLLAAGAGSFILSGQDAGLVYTPAWQPQAYVMAASRGLFILTGKNVVFLAPIRGPGARAVELVERRHEDVSGVIGSIQTSEQSVVAPEPRPNYQAEQGKHYGD